MITIDDYFGKWLFHDDATEKVKVNSALLLNCVNALLLDYGVEMPVNPATNSCVAGATFGGFRPSECTQGAATSSHKEGRGIDLYDPQNKLDDWLDDERLSKYNLYREAPLKTPGWCHLTTRAPHSGKRTFLP